MLEAWSVPDPGATFTARVMERVQAQAVCEPVRAALVMVNGVIEPSVRAHVEACQACADEAAELRRCWAVLGNWSDVEPSSGFARSVATRVASAPRLAPRASFSRVLRWWGSVAAMLAVLLGTFAAVQTRPPTGGAKAVALATSNGLPQQMGALQPRTAMEADGDDVLDDFKEPAPHHKTDAIIEELLTASVRTPDR